MTRKVTSYRLPEMTLNQLKTLTESTGSSDANVISIAIDRMYREEIKNMTTSKVSRESITETFNLMFNDVPLAETEETAAYDAMQAEKQAEAQEALNRFMAGTNDLEDALRLEKAGLVVAIYGRADERPVGFRLRKIDGNEYSDQAGIEENPPRR